MYDSPKEEITKKGKAHLGALFVNFKKSTVTIDFY